MIIKKEVTKKKNYFFSFNKFLYFYFFLSLAIICIFLTIVFQSHLFSQQKIKFLDRFSKAGRYEYLYLPQIVFKAIKSNFYKLEKLDVQIPFENTLILENLRNESIKNGILPPAVKMPKVKTKIVYNEKEFRADIRLKGDRKAHFIDKEKSSYKLELDRDQFIFSLLFLVIPLITICFVSLTSLFNNLDKSLNGLIISFCSSSAKSTFE